MARKGLANQSASSAVVMATKAAIAHAAKSRMEEVEDFPRFICGTFIYFPEFGAAATLSQAAVMRRHLLLPLILLVGAATALQPPKKLAGSPFQRLQNGVTLTSVRDGKNVALTSLWSGDETCVVEMLRHYG